MDAPHIEPAELHADAHERRRALHVRMPALTDGEIIALRREELERYTAKLGMAIDRAKAPQGIDR
jgi:hypothetical protein